MIDPSTPTTLYAGTAFDGVFRSVDRGATWNGIDNGLTDPMVTALAIDPNATATVYAGTFGGTFVYK